MPSSTGPSIDTIIEGGQVTQVGGGREPDEVSPTVLTFGAPTVGEILAERYELAEHIDNDSAGRQVWRGVDVVLRRPVAVVLRHPGGESATEMLQAAVAASRVIHPNLVGVYDAIDEGGRAYVVREWVEGQSLRDLVSQGPLDPVRATSVVHAVAGAIAAIHATGMVHGNVHPGTVMIGDDGRVVLADARTDSADTPATDIRNVGGLLYYALTGRWPHAEASLGGAVERRGRALPDAVRDASGAIAAPRQVRAEVPAYLDDLTMDLLDSRITPPTAEVLTAELDRLDTATEEHYLDTSPLRFTTTEATGPEASALGGRKVAFGVAGLLVVALLGLIIGVTTLGGDRDTNNQAGPAPTFQAGVPTSEATTPAKKPKPVALSSDQIRIVDPEGDRAEVRDTEKIVDGDPNVGWATDSYWNRPDFGGAKKGMGILIDLGEPRAVTSVQVALSAPGASAELRTGDSVPAESSNAADKKLVADFTTRIGEPFEQHNGSTMTFSSFEPDQTYRYLLFWLTGLPEDRPGAFKVGVQEITVLSR